MQIPVETKPAIWGAVCGAVALAVVGFTWGGWVTAGTADKNSKLRAENAVVEALAPICVENFNDQPDAAGKLAELKEVSSWQQGDFISKGGWATIIEGTKPDSAVAKACANTLSNVKS
ncbi:hypothetical protein [Bosea sp. (in: a-proteobacteria)]|uniref:hypothetical protein n=1 Tax=Bosea sp. (in: a-proteobacteria) TaxID=1871050 RepID=UPI002FCA73AA